MEREVMSRRGKILNAGTSMNLMLSHTTYWHQTFFAEILWTLIRKSNALHEPVRDFQTALPCHQLATSTHLPTVTWSARQRTTKVL